MLRGVMPGTRTPVSTTPSVLPKKRIVVKTVVAIFRMPLEEPAAVADRFPNTVPPMRPMAPNISEIAPPKMPGNWPAFRNAVAIRP